MIFFLWKAISWRTHFLSLEWWSEVISVPLIITAINLPSTDAFSPFPQLPNKLLSDVFQPSLPCRSCRLAAVDSVLDLFYEERGESVLFLLVPEVIWGIKVHREQRATGYADEIRFLSGLFICIWCRRTKHCRSPLITNGFVLKMKGVRANEVHTKTRGGHVTWHRPQQTGRKLSQQSLSCCILCTKVQRLPIFFERFVQVLMLIILFLFINRFDYVYLSKQTFFGWRLELLAEDLVHY